MKNGAKKEAKINEQSINKTIRKKKNEKRELTPVKRRAGQAPGGITNSTR